MYSALCANDCTITTEDGVLIKEIEANKQDFFVAPSSKVVTTDDSVILTECFNLASFGLSAEWGADSEGGGDTSDLSDDVSELQTLVSGLDTDLSSLSSQVNNSASQLTSLSNELSSLDESLLSLSSDVTSISEQLESSVSLLPDWDNYVTLSSSNMPYTAPCIGWITGSITHTSSGDIYINGVTVANCNGDHVTVQMLVSAGDIVSISATGSSFRFIPAKN